jgi:cytochrome c-type biogenesis protein CcmH/NrfG
LSLHALGRYGEAVCSLEIAERLDPRNKQVVEALKMAAFKARRQPRD